jgi:transcriptional regulator with XRE-family HTH domain
LASSPLAVKLESIRERAGISSREVAQLLDTTPQTVSRWQVGKVAPQPDRLERLLALEWLVTELAEIYKPGEAKLWLYSHHKLLEGERPADLISNGRAQEVLELIDQLRDSAFT